MARVLCTIFIRQNKKPRLEARRRNHAREHHTDRPEPARDQARPADHREDDADPQRDARRRNRGVRPVAPAPQRLRRDPQILGDLFDRLGLRRIRTVRLGQQPDRLRLELRRISRALCYDSIISPQVRGNAEQESVHIKYFF